MSELVLVDKISCFITFAIIGFFVFLFRWAVDSCRTSPTGRKISICKQIAKHGAKSKFLMNIFPSARQTYHDDSSKMLNDDEGGYGGNHKPPTLVGGLPVVFREGRTQNHLQLSYP